MLVPGRVFSDQPVLDGVGATREVEDLPTWLVVWRGARQRAVTGPTGGDDTIVGSVFLVHGVTGSCCPEAIVLAEGSRLR